MKVPNRFEQILKAADVRPGFARNLAYPKYEGVPRRIKLDNASCRAKIGFPTILNNGLY